MGHLSSSALGSAVFAVVLSTVAVPASALDITVDSTTTPEPGLRIDAVSIASPKTKAWVAHVDLCAARVRVDATASPSTLRTAGSWGSSVGATLAVNGDFYKTGPLRVYGAAAGDGSAWPASKTGTDSSYSAEWYYERYGWLAFGQGWVELNHTEWVKQNEARFGGLREGWRPTDVTHAIPPGTVALVSGFPELVVEGTRVTCSSPTASDCFPDRSDMRDRHPRTAMGITEDRRTLILAVVDGRTSTSIGMYGAELAELMEDVGAWNAFNLDGGGSTQMWLDGSGYLNNTTGNNGGGSTRSVANHWGIFAGGSGDASPAHCIDHLVQGVLNVASPRSTDLDADGRADVCIRATDGLRCAMSQSDELSFGPDELLVELADESGWDDLRNAATLRTGDVDGDGTVDVCARANAGIRCWTTASTPLDTAIDGPGHSDDSGWNTLAYHSTFRLADIDGDGRDDVCARASIGLVCYPSTGDGFGEGIKPGVFADDDGFLEPDNYMTIRMGDVDGDGRVDTCARTDEGMRCYLAPDFVTEIEGPAWSDEAGWAAPMRWATIALRDVDGDGRADLCGRAEAGYVCHLSTGGGFGPEVSSGVLGDADGFDRPDRYGSIRLEDIDGDRDRDLCAPVDDAWRCWAWTGDSFGASVEGPAYAPMGEGLLPRLYAGTRLADVDGDGRADLCGRDDVGMWCARSTGDGFEAPVAGPSWAGLGFESPSVFGTLALGQPNCTAGVEWCNAVDDDCDGVVDEDCEEGPGPGSGGQGGAAATPGPDGTGDDALSGGCACRAGAPDAPSGGVAWWAFGLTALAARRRRSDAHGARRV